MAISITEQVYLSDAKIKNLKRCFSDVMEVAEHGGGLHPKMAEVLGRIFEPLSVAYRI